MVEAVTFDLWETLICDAPENRRRGRALRVLRMGELLARAGHPRPEARLAWAHDETGRRLEGLWAAGRDCSTSGQVAIFLGCLGVPAEAVSDIRPALEDTYASAVLEAGPRLKAGAGEVLADLRARGIRIGLISNTGRTPGRVLRIILRGFGILEHFDALSFSDEVEWRKPHPAVFRRTLGALAARADRTVHVGDNPVDDIRGARGAGMRAILLGTEQTDGADAAVRTLDQVPKALDGLDGFL